MTYRVALFGRHWHRCCPYCFDGGWALARNVAVENAADHALYSGHW